MWNFVLGCVVIIVALVIKDFVIKPWLLSRKTKWVKLDATPTLQQALEKDYSEQVDSLVSSFAQVNDLIASRVQEYLDNNLQFGAYLINVYSACSSAFNGVEAQPLGPFLMRDGHQPNSSITEGNARIACCDNKGDVQGILLLSNTFPHLRIESFPENTKETIFKLFCAAEYGSSKKAWHETSSDQERAKHKLDQLQKRIDSQDEIVAAICKAVDELATPLKDASDHGFKNNAIANWFGLSGSYALDSYWFGKQIAERALSVDSLIAANHNGLFELYITEGDHSTTYEFSVKHKGETVVLIDTSKTERVALPTAFSVLGMPLALRYEQELVNLLCTAATHQKKKRDEVDPLKTLGEIQECYYASRSRV